MIEIIEHDGVRFAEVLRKDLKVSKTTFFSPPDSSFQFGVIAHEKGYKEPPHSHKPFKRIVNDMQQMLSVQRGKAAMDFFDDNGKLFKTILLDKGDSILLCSGAHSLRAIEDFQCVSVKQGPFMGIENDKVVIRENK